MIRIRTVFVLGAGASVPFGFPTGAKLRSLICEEVGSHGSLTNEMLSAAGHTKSTLELFAEAFKRSGFNSIDRFLAMRPSVQELGRQAIVACLAQFHQEDKLYSANGAKGTSDWYGYLFNLMADTAFTAQEFVSGNNVAFITFNYDLSLERFFWNALSHGYNLPAPEATAAIQRLKIHHVYGSLTTPSDPVRYQPWFSPQELREVSGQLLVLPHERPTADSTCLDYLVGARQIYFLGFGFDEMNCARLGIVQARRDTGPGHSVFGTVLGATTAERSLATAALGGAMPMPPTLHNLDCLSLLREHAADLRS